ncbi:MAG: choice-of-anchor D domain-containing protein, partial [Saprospiraceae bacterium]
FAVTVTDAEKPTITCPANQTVSADANCGGTVGVYSAVSTADNCATTVTVTQSPASTTALSGHDDAETVTLTANDGNGNTQTCTFTVTLKDVTKPTITCPADQTVSTDANCAGTVGDRTGAATASDNCAATVTVTQSPASTTALNGHDDAETVTLTADDGNGNTETCTFTVTLKDVTLPTTVCQNIGVDLSIIGEASITAAEIDNGSDDACGVSDRSISPTAFTCADLGANTVTLTVTDNNGNSNTCTATVTVSQPVSGACTPVVIASATPVDAICGAPGSITVVFSGGAGPYDIEWTGGSADGITSPYTISDLSAGTYGITVTAANLTTSTASPVVQYLPVHNTTANTRHATVQAAINAAAANDILAVCAGTYNEDVNVNKAVALRGANYGLCYHDENRGTESTIAGPVTLSATGASLDGFRLTKRANSSTTDGVLFTNWSGLSLQVTGTNTAVRNNIIEMYGGASASNHAVVLNAPGAATFQCNEVLGGAGYLAQEDARGMSGLRLTNTASNYSLSGNRIGVSTGRAVPGADVDAVSFYNVGNANFDGNVVHGNILGGVVLYGQLNDISITNNTIENYTGTGIRVMDMFGYNSATADVTISGNVINGGAGATGVGILGVPAADILALNNNSITGNAKSIEFTGTGALPATCNWYGTTDVAVIAASLDTTVSPGVNTVVTCEPFLTSGVDANPALAGFQPATGAQQGYLSVVSGNGQPISKGSTTYTATNLTLMGSAPVGGYIVRNYSFTSATSCGGTSGVTFTSLSFTGAGAGRFSLGNVATGTEYAPGTYGFTISYQSHTSSIEDEVTCTMTTSSGVYTFKLRAVTTPSSPAVAEIRGNSVVISNGDFSPSVSDRTDFGILAAPGVLTRTFTVTNAGPTGCDPLSLTGSTPITLAGGAANKFSVTANTCTEPLVSGASCTFTVTFTSGATAGVSNTMIRVANSDAARNPYEYSIRAELQSPSLSFTGNNTLIANGDNTPDVADYTLMGSLVAGQTITRSYKLKNLGLGILQIGANAVTISAAGNGPGHTNFTVATQPAAGAYTTNQEAFLSLRFTSPGPGSYYALVTFVTVNAGTFTFVVQGNGPTPRMQVVGNSVDIPSGRTTVSTADGTNFGARGLNTNTDRTFTVRNPGSLGAAAPLNLTQSPLVTIGGANPAMFQVSIQPSSSISVNGSTTFRIRYRPTSAGCHYATISIPSNDPDPARSPYTFTVFGKSTGSDCPDYVPFPTDQEFSTANRFEFAINTGNDAAQVRARGQEDEEAPALALYPNPATDRVLIEAPKSAESQMLSFVDERGVTVYTFETTGGIHSIDLAGFAPGVYMVVSSDRRIAPKRLVKL